jgi:DNA-binding PucR family transcriptional regulator
MFLGQRPDITPSQIVAIIGNVIAVAVAFGAHITKQQQDAILALAAVLGAFLIASDAHLRGRRAHASAIRDAAQVQAAAQSTTTTALAPATVNPETPGAVPPQS